MEVFLSNKYAIVAGWITKHYDALSQCFVHIMQYVTEFIVVPDKITIIYFKLIQQRIICLLYHIMLPFKKKASTIDNYIKCFLRGIEHFEDYRNIFALNAPLMWYLCSNFLSLLNLPNQIKQFGSVKFYQEGLCERHI